MTTPAAEWLIRAGAPADDLYRAWARGAAVEVPIGELWEVVRITARLGDDAVRRLQDAGVDLGPVLDAPMRRAVELFVPLGTVTTWPRLRGTLATRRGYTLCPPPHMTATSGLRSTGARRWIVPPLSPVTTDPDALCEAVAAALWNRATALVAKAGRGESAGRRITA